MLFIGIDPGASGAIAVIDEFGAYVADLKLKDATERDIWVWVEDHCNQTADVHAAVELVHSMPKQGVASSFKFGFSAGFLRGLLVASAIPFVVVSPQRWQKEMNCMTRGDKNISKEAAQRIWTSGVRITHANADALLIAEYCRRQWTKSQPAPTETFALTSV
jgi:crossover junction endodeoxyribonuclease RuvC